MGFWAQNLLTQARFCITDNLSHTMCVETNDYCTTQGCTQNRYSVIVYTLRALENIDASECCNGSNSPKVTPGHSIYLDVFVKSFKSNIDSVVPSSITFQ